MNLKRNNNYIGYLAGKSLAYELGLRNNKPKTLELITKNYEDEYNSYFAAISKGVFMNMAMNKKVSGKISLGV